MRVTEASPRGEALKGIVRAQPSRARAATLLGALILAICCVPTGTPVGTAPSGSLSGISFLACGGACPGICPCPYQLKGGSTLDL
jgi:hypothetical protein